MHLTEAFFQKHQAQLDTYGEPVMFWPTLPEERLVTGIVYRSAGAEPTSPGNITRVWIRDVDLLRTVERMDEVMIGVESYSVTDVNSVGDGSTNVLIRKMSYPVRAGRNR